MSVGFKDEDVIITGGGRGIGREAALAFAEESADAIITSSDDAIVSKDLNGVVTSWNRAAERLFGFTADEMIGHSIRRIIPSNRQSEEDDVLSRVRRGERVEHFETVRQRKDGSEVTISLTVSPVRDRHGSIIGASKIARDITQQKEAERMIREALAVKDEFIGLVSHELRNPLTTILGNAALLARHGQPLDDEERVTAAADVEREARRLNSIIDDLLSLARLEQGSIEHEPIVLSRFAERIVSDHVTASGREIALRVDSEGTLVTGDDRLLGHVLTNYLSNAVKYSPPDSTIEVVVDAVDGHGRLLVLDRGIGIDPAEADRLFEAFYRSKNVGTVGGVGVGLSACRRLITAIGGTCWASFRDGGGSEFGFSLPLFVPDAFED